uniref:Uncharacterized protein n=1 Tax=Cryptosporidium parvum TaxID=5807 RepID=F0X5D9_CRYPV
MNLRPNLSSFCLAPHPGSVLRASNESGRFSTRASIASFDAIELVLEIPNSAAKFLLSKSN